MSVDKLTQIRFTETAQERELRIAKEKLIALVDRAQAAIDEEQAACRDRIERQRVVYYAVNNADQELFESLSLDEREAMYDSLAGFDPPYSDIES